MSDAFEHEERDAVIDLSAAVHPLEQLARTVEDAIDDHGWDQLPHLFWVTLTEDQAIRCTEGKPTRALIDAGPVDFLEGLTAAMPRLTHRVIGIIFICESWAVPDDGGPRVELRRTFALNIDGDHEVYLIRGRGAGAIRLPVPDGDPVLLALRRMVRRAAAMRGRPPMRVPPERLN